MKKILLLLAAAMLLPMAINAQLLSNNDVKLQRAPYELKSFSPRIMSPARANLGENQMILGHYDTDDYTTSGLGLQSYPGVIPTAIILEPEELSMFLGGKIVKFRVGLAQSTTISRVFVAPVSSDGYIGTFTEWSCSANSVGWNEITLSTPYEINLASDEALMIGYDYKQTRTNYPISAVEVGDLYPTYLYVTYNGTPGWYDFGVDSYGNVSLQCIVESESFPDYMININGLSVNRFIHLGDNIEFSFNTRNMGVATENVAVGACSYDVLIDGVYVTTITNPEAFGTTEIQISNAVASTGLAVGNHTLTVKVNALNGVPVEDPFVISRNFTVYEHGFARQMHLIEEFTSNSCMWCPLGLNMLKTLYNMRDDIAMVAIHGNQSAVDPCNTAQCDTLYDYMGTNGWPSAAFNRSTGWEDDETIATGIGYYEQYHQEVAEALSSFLDYLAEAPSFATININSKIDDETNVATVTIDGKVTPDFVDMMGQDAKLSVFLTEDSIVYRQNNEGTYVQQFQHDHVFRAVLGPTVFGNALNITGETYKNEYTITLPTSWKKDKMEVIAFISRPLANGGSGDYTDMYVTQAFKRKLGVFDEITSLRGDVDGNGEVSIEDVTKLISYLLTGNGEINEVNANCNLDGEISIEDVTKLISYLLTGNW